MKFFAFVALAASAAATNTFSQAEKEELFELWTAQAEAGEIEPEVYYMLAQALDGDAPEAFYAETEVEEDEEAAIYEFAQFDGPGII